MLKWSKEQVLDKTRSRVIDLLHTGHCPAKDVLRFETPDVNKYIREWSKLTMIDNVLYRNTTLDGEPTRQLVLPQRFQAAVLKHLHDDFSHQGRDRTLYLVRSRFFFGLV